MLQINSTLKEEDQPDPPRTCMEVQSLASAAALLRQPVYQKNIKYVFPLTKYVKAKCSVTSSSLSHSRQFKCGHTYNMRNNVFNTMMVIGRILDLVKLFLDALE